MRCFLDTDIASELLKAKNPLVLQRGNNYLSQYGSFSISLMTRYEILRGLKAMYAAKRLAKFETWCQLHNILSIPEEIVVLAADLYADLKRNGQLIGDNDLFIAATALHHGLSLATSNLAHFNRIPGLIIEDWAKP